jgi:hypothetical protein
MRQNERREPRVEALPGSLHLQRVKCGKSNCRCASGKSHAAYYRFWREDGRLRKAYVRRADLETVRAGLARWRECRAVCRSLVSGPDLANALHEQRENLRAAGVEPRASFLPRAEGRRRRRRINRGAGRAAGQALPDDYVLLRRLALINSAGTARETKLGYPLRSWIPHERNFTGYVRRENPTRRAVQILPRGGPPSLPDARRDVSRMVCLALLEARPVFKVRHRGPARSRSARDAQAVEVPARVYASRGSLGAEALGLYGCGVLGAAARRRGRAQTES